MLTSLDVRDLVFIPTIPFRIVGAVAGIAWDELMWRHKMRRITARDELTAQADHVRALEKQVEWARRDGDRRMVRSLQRELREARRQLEELERCYLD